MAPSSWTAPPNVSTEIRQEAGHRAGVLASALASAPPPGIVRQWLGMLGVACAGGRMEGDDAKAKMAVYEALLDYPHACYTADSIRTVTRAMGAKGGFFPSLGELQIILDAERARLESELGRCRALLGQPTKATAPGQTGKVTGNGHGTAEQWTFRLEKFRVSAFWVESTWGGRPGSGTCLAPLPAIQAVLGDEAADTEAQARKRGREGRTAEQLEEVSELLRKWRSA